MVPPICVRRAMVPLYLDPVPRGPLGVEMGSLSCVEEPRLPLTLALTLSLTPI